MALLKAFVCQVVLFGLYKLFLEQVVVDHLVPEELTRNCLVGLVILLCFGIQLYTDKVEDDPTDAEEDLKGKSTEVKKIESSEIPMNHEIIRNTADLKAEVISTENKNYSTVRKVIDSKETSSTVLTNSPDKTSHSDNFGDFWKNVPDKIAVAASIVETSIEANTFPELNRISEVNPFEESDEECIQIDQFVSKAPSKEPVHPKTVGPKQVEDFMTESKEVEALHPTQVGEPQQLITVEVKEVEAVHPKLMEKPEQLITVEDKEVDSFKPELMEEYEKLIVEDKKVEAINPEQAKEAVTKYECLTSIDTENSSTQDLNSNPISESEKLTVDTEEVQPIKPEHVTETAGEFENLMSNGVINSSTQDLNSNSTGEPQQQMKIELNTTVPDQLTKDVVQYECLVSNGVNSLSEELSLDPVIDESYSKITNDSLNNIADAPLDPRDETATNSITDAKEIGDAETSTDASLTDEHAKNLSKSSQYVQEIDCKNTEAPKMANKSGVDKNIEETSTVVNTKLPSTRISASEGAYITYFPIDITFIYACHKH